MARRYGASALKTMKSRETYGADYKRSNMIMKEDSGMIREDMSARANLPREVIEKEFDNPYGYMPGAPADLYSGAQKTIKENHRDLMKILKPTK